MNVPVSSPSPIRPFAEAAAVRFWVRLVESRLGCSLYDAEELNAM